MSIITNALKKAQDTHSYSSSLSGVAPLKKKRILAFKPQLLMLGTILIFAGISYLLLNAKNRAPLPIQTMDIPVPVQNQIFAVAPTQKTELPVLSGIMYSSTTPQAIIDGTMVSEGKSFGSFSIVKILPDKVIITSDEKEFELKVQ